MGKFDHIPELTGASAFHAWKSQVVLTLGREGAYNHVSDGLDPTDFAEFASVLPTPADVAAPTAAEHTLILEWLKEDAVAKDIICHRLFPAVQRLIPQEHSVTACDAWSLLHSHFNHVDLGSQHLIREKILSLQMADAADAERYLGEHDALWRDLIRMGVAYSNSEAIFNLLKGLPRTGTWPAFKLVLQSSLSVASVASVASASSSLAKGKGKSVLSSSASSSSVSGCSSISGLLGSGTATFESISVHIVAEAHHLVLEASISPLVGSEFTNVAKTSRQTNVNPTTGLRCTKNNPSGVYCDTPLDNGSVCGAGSHDRAHCFKPGGGMAGQQPAHWKPFWRSKSGASDSSASANSAVGVPSGSAMQQPPLVAAAVVAPTPPSVPSSAWTTQEYDLSCTSIADLDDGDGCCPSDDVLACLSVQSYSSLLDTGTSRTLVRDCTHFHSYAMDGSVHVKTANHGRLPTLGSGDCIALLPVGQDKFSVCFSGCLHVPSAMLNLLSIGSMVAKGWECNFRGAPPRCELVYHAQPLGSHLLQNNLCFLDVDFLHFDTPLPLLRSPVPLSAFARVSPTSDLWHARLGHVGGNAATHVARFADGAVVDPSPLSICKSCIVGKHARQPFHPSETQCSSGFLDLVHADVAGPMPVFTPHGKRYLLVILDDYMHVLDVHLLTTKDQALEAWEITHRRWENKYSRQVKTFRTDNGGEFVNSAFVTALNAAGISHQLSVPYMHQQNGKAERVIRTVEGRVLAMLHFAGLSQTYWGEAALTAAYLHNCTESQALPSGKTPYEMLHGACPNISHLRVWGCRGFARIPLELQQKLGPKSREVLFMGYPPGVKGYRVRDKATGQFFNCRDVIFDENLALPHLFGDASVPAPDPCDDDDGDSDDDNGLPARSPALSPLLLSVPSSTVPSLPVMSSSSPPALRRSDRARTLTEAGRASRMASSVPRRVWHDRSLHLLWWWLAIFSLLHSRHFHHLLLSLILLTLTCPIAVALTLCLSLKLLLILSWSSMLILLSGAISAMTLDPLGAISASLLPPMRKPCGVLMLISGGPRWRRRWASSTICRSMTLSLYRLVLMPSVAGGFWSTSQVMGRVAQWRKLVLWQRVSHRSQDMISDAPLLLLLVRPLFMSSPLIVLGRIGNCIRWTSNGLFYMERSMRLSTSSSHVDMRHLAPMVSAWLDGLTLLSTASSRQCICFTKHCGRN